jgi:hypothetical protein
MSMPNVRDFAGPYPLFGLRWTGNYELRRGLGPIGWIIETLKLFKKGRDTFIFDTVCADEIQVLYTGPYFG